MKIDPATFARLPSLPAVAVKLLQHYANPDISLAAVAEILRPDPALTTRLLKAASSAEFGIGKPLTDARRAVQLLGMRRVTSLALSFLLSAESTKPGPVGTLFRETWVRCVVQAVAMEIIASKRARGAEAEHYTAGLLLEAGALALLRLEPQEFVKVAEAIWHEPERRDQIEMERLGCTQADITIAMFKYWKMPPVLVDVVRRRREPVIELSQAAAPSTRALLEGAALATGIGDYFCSGDSGRALIRCMEVGEGLFGLEITGIRKLLGDVHTRVQAAAALFNTDISKLETPEVLMERARVHLERHLGGVECLSDGQPGGEQLQDPEAAELVASAAS